ncbi:TetR/AcrR family transcriptional regulator [Paroceanicella profunda]|uniref:TetR/AcrR family transcriptional regulator n=1 Tax=Paroceanicella profunda TaxID=2579971 RepID=A0A5B8G071_9RHOB|nr:TetR/AcrR family transcriptional regulator [Paroceanicella profunda]QDL93100.1 TetR/AcrR family transcriptional regulator [Paroceanicella profunda]
MGRYRSFDETRAMDAAIACFRERGFHAASMRDLEREMGLTSSSLYNAFGSKKELFLSALDAYLNASSRRRIALLDAAEDPLAGIEAFLFSVVSVSAADRCGCLLVNSAASAAALDKDIGAAVRDGLGEVEAAFARTLQRAVAAGALPETTDSTALARTLLGTIVSIRVLSRSAPGEAWLRSLADGALTQIHAPANTRATPRKRVS